MIPEILSPAGNPEKLAAALRFGADAVYLAGNCFGMRASAANFTLEELAEAVSYAHNLGKKIYLTVNTMPREYELPALETYLEHLKSIPLDALIIADFGVLSIAKRILPHIPVHVSTQTFAEMYQANWNLNVLCMAPCACRGVADACSPTTSQAETATVVCAPSHVVGNIQRSNGALSKPNAPTS